MERTFEVNAVKPGDSNYKYDVRKDFGNSHNKKYDPDWDSFEDDEDDSRF